MKRKVRQIELLSLSAQQTMDIARLMGKRLKRGDILALSGDLGSGKTCFTGGLAKGLGLSKEYRITSPTFTLINEYQGRCNLYHFDVYRLNGCKEFEELGYEEYFSANGVVAIEWAEKIESILPENIISIKFDYVDENIRKIIIKGLKDKLDEITQDLNTEVV